MTISSRRHRRPCAKVRRCARIEPMPDPCPPGIRATIPAREHAPPCPCPHANSPLSHACEPFICRLSRATGQPAEGAAVSPRLADDAYQSLIQPHHRPRHRRHRARRAARRAQQLPRGRSGSSGSAAAAGVCAMRGWPPHAASCCMRPVRGPYGPHATPRPLPRPYRGPDSVSTVSAARTGARPAKSPDLFRSLCLWCRVSPPVSGMLELNI